MPSKSNGYGLERQHDPRRQVGYKLSQGGGVPGARHPDWGLEGTNARIFDPPGPGRTTYVAPAGQAIGRAPQGGSDMQSTPSELQSLGAPARGQGITNGTIGGPAGPMQRPAERVKGPQYGPNNLPPDFGDEDGPSDDSWINKAYMSQSQPNPNYRGRPGGS